MTRGKAMLEKYKNKLVAHRGLYDNIIIPENSLRAFKNAIINNYPIELDLHLTKDNNLVVFHDHNLKRMTNINLTIEDLTVKDLNKITLLNTKEKIPTLDEVLKLVNSKVLIIIEIKCKTNEKLITKILLEKLNDYQGEIIIQAFNSKIVKLLKKEQKKFPVGLLISEQTDTKKFKIFNTSIFDIKYCHPDFLSVSRKILKRKHLKKYLKKCPILVWTIKKHEELPKQNKNYIYICDNLPYQTL